MFDVWAGWHRDVSVTITINGFHYQNLVQSVRKRSMALTVLKKIEDGLLHLVWHAYRQRHRRAGE